INFFNNFDKTKTETYFIMKKIFLLGTMAAILFTSCVSKKEYAALEAKQKETQDLLNSATVKLNTCLEEKASLEGLKDQIAMLKANNQELINNMGNLTTLTTKGASNRSEEHTSELQS